MEYAPNVGFIIMWTVLKVTKYTLNNEKYNNKEEIF